MYACRRIRLGTDRLNKQFPITRGTELSTIVDNIVEQLGEFVKSRDIHVDGCHGEPKRKAIPTGNIAEAVAI